MTQGSHALMSGKMLVADMPEADAQGGLAVPPDEAGLKVPPADEAADGVVPPQPASIAQQHRLPATPANLPIMRFPFSGSRPLIRKMRPWAACSRCNTVPASCLLAAPARNAPAPRGFRA